MKINDTTYLLLGGLGAAIALYFYSRTQSGQDAADLTLDYVSIGVSRVENLVSKRGYRNNNPGNIRYLSSNAWNGQVGNDGGYGVYDSPQNGTRALGHQLRKYGLDTVAGIITKWAPAEDNNNTAAYIRDVSTELGVGAYDSIDVESYLAQLARAIAKHENGYVDDSYDWNWVYLP